MQEMRPQAHAAMTVLNKELGLSYGKVSHVFQNLFGISLARATAARSLLRTARRCGPDYEAIRGEIRGSPWVVPDETGWRVGGQPAWLHAAVVPSATCYEIAPGRDHNVLERILGEDWQGTLIHDGGKAYDYFTRVFHQQCLHHLRHRCEKILETASGAATRFPRQIMELIETAFLVRRRYRGHRLSANDLVDESLGLGCLLEELAAGCFTYEPNRRLAKHLLRHRMQWFWFLIDPQIDATNYRAEQALRPAVVNRKVWGGNRTWIGAKAQSILTSVLRTCAQKGRSALDHLVEILCLPRPDPLLAYGR
jgi:transposase